MVKAGIEESGKKNSTHNPGELYTYAAQDAFPTALHVSDSCHRYMYRCPRRAWSLFAMSICAQRSPAHWVCPSSHSGPQFRSWPQLSGADAGTVPSGQLEGERVGPWPAGLPRAGGGGLLKCTISRPAFDLGQRLPGSKWSQLLLQATASQQPGGGGGVGLEDRGV